MTKKNIWAKLLIVALIVAMVSAFFIACDPKNGDNGGNGGNTGKPCTEHVDNDGDGLCDICGEEVEVEEEIDTTAVEALLGVVDDAVAELAKVENVGNLGTDAYVEVKVNDTTVRVDLDLSLDLLNEASGGTGYANNGFGFTVSVNGTQEFGLWYVNGEADEYQYVYLKTKDQNLKISALTLANVLERYNVNANVPTNDTLDISVVDMASSYIGMIASMVDIDYTESNGNKTFSLNIKELFNPEGDLIGVVDALFFGEEAAIGVDLGGILKDQNINITSTAASTASVSVSTSPVRRSPSPSLPAIPSSSMRSPIPTYPLRSASRSSPTTRLSPTLKPTRLKSSKLTTGTISACSTSLSKPQSNSAKTLTALRPTT